MLAHREQVADCLAGMGEVGEGIYDRYGGVFRENLQVSVREDPCDNDIHEAVEDSRDVFGGFPCSEANVRLTQVYAGAAHLLYTNLEADSRSERGLFEEKGGDLAVHGFGCNAFFHRAGFSDYLGDLVGCEVAEPQKVIEFHCSALLIDIRCVADSLQ